MLNLNNNPQRILNALKKFEMNLPANATTASVDSLVTQKLREIGFPKVNHFEGKVTWNDFFSTWKSGYFFSDDGFRKRLSNEQIDSLTGTYGYTDKQVKHGVWSHALLLIAQHSAGIDVKPFFQTLGARRAWEAEFAESESKFYLKMSGDNLFRRIYDLPSNASTANPGNPHWLRWALIPHLPKLGPLWE